MKLTINLWWAIILSTFAVRAHGHSTNGTAVTDANSACVPEEKSCRLQARNASSQILSRRKRYLAFPEGSSISVMCFLHFAISFPLLSDQFQFAAIMPCAGGILFGNRVDRESEYPRHQLAIQLGRRIRSAQQDMDYQRTRAAKSAKAVSETIVPATASPRALSQIGGGRRQVSTDHERMYECE